MQSLMLMTYLLYCALLDCECTLKLVRSSDSVVGRFPLTCLAFYLKVVVLMSKLSSTCLASQVKWLRLSTTCFA